MAIVASILFSTLFWSVLDHFIVSGRKGKMQTRITKVKIWVSVEVKLLRGGSSCPDLISSRGLKQK